MLDTIEILVPRQDDRTRNELAILNRFARRKDAAKKRRPSKI
jgi:hypothetical protein